MLAISPELYFAANGNKLVGYWQFRILLRGYLYACKSKNQNIKEVSTTCTDSETAVQSSHVNAGNFSRSLQVATNLYVVGNPAFFRLKKKRAKK